MKEWEDDFEMQLHTIKEQSKSARKVIDYINEKIPNDILNKIKADALTEWENDYEMQLDTIKIQSKAWIKLNNY